MYGHLPALSRHIVDGGEALAHEVVKAVLAVHEDAFKEEVGSTGKTFRNNLSFINYILEYLIKKKTLGGYSRFRNFGNRDKPNFRWKLL